MKKSEKLVRLLAGTVILVSVGLTLLHSSWWLLLTAFVGINLIQSVFTGFCPPTIIGRKLGWFPEEQDCIFERPPSKEARS